MKRRLWLWALLAASVALNLFFAGLWAGGRLGDAPHGRGREHPALAELPAPTRQILRTAVDRARPDRQAARQARREAARILAADPFDRAAAEAALSTARQRNVAARTRTDAALLDAAADLGPEDRAVLARLLQRGGEGRERERSRP